MGKLVSIEMDFPELAEKVKAAEDEINLFIAAQVQTNRGLLFDSEGAHNGHERWAPLRLRNGQIMSRSGTLRKSIAPYNATGQPGPGGIVRFEGDTIVVGTTLGYARMMNDGTVNLPGGVLRPVNAEALAIPLPSGVMANPEAKKLRKKASGRRDLEASIKKLRSRIRTTSGPEKRKLQEKLKRYTAKLNDSPKNERVMFRKSVKIPPRPFDNWTNEDETELTEALTNKIGEVIDRG